MPSESPNDLTSLAVAMGEFRATLAAGFSSVNDRLDKLTSSSEAHSDTLSRHEVEIQLLKSRESPKKTWVEYINGVVGVLTAITLVAAIVYGFAAIMPALSK